MKYRVVIGHESECLEPIVLSQGNELAVGQRYDGDEGWEGWYWCRRQQQQGWVPEQLIDWIEGASGLIKEDYDSSEMTVAPGQVIVGSRMMNGWVWATIENGDESGWVPLRNLVLEG